MKAYLFLAVLAAVPACTKKNEAGTLRHEAVAVAKYYAPELDALDARVTKIFKRGQTIPANLPGVDIVGQNLTEARDMIVQLRGIVGAGADGKSAVEKQADDAAKNRRIGDLEKLIHDTHHKLETETVVINDKLQSVESWIAQYDRQALATTIEVGQPPASAPSTTGQPPGTGAQPVPAGGAATPPGTAGGPASATPPTQPAPQPAGTPPTQPTPPTTPAPARPAAQPGAATTPNR